MGNAGSCESTLGNGNGTFVRVKRTGLSDDDTSNWVDAMERTRGELGLVISGRTEDASSVSFAAPFTRTWVYNHTCLEVIDDDDVPADQQAELRRNAPVIAGSIVRVLEPEPDTPHRRAVPWSAAHRATVDKLGVVVAGDIDTSMVAFATDGDDDDDDDAAMLLAPLRFHDRNIMLLFDNEVDSATRQRLATTARRVKAAHGANVSDDDSDGSDDDDGDTVPARALAELGAALASRRRRAGGGGGGGGGGSDGGARSSGDGLAQLVGRAMRDRAPPGGGARSAAPNTAAAATTTTTTTPASGNNRLARIERRLADMEAKIDRLYEALVGDVE